MGAAVVGRERGRNGRYKGVNRLYRVGALLHPMSLDVTPSFGRRAHLFCER